MAIIDNPTDYFNTITWTGASNTAGRSFTGVGFQPNLVWSKIRDDTYHHNWFDSVRGAGSDKEINSDTSGAEGSGDTDGYGFISSFDTDGFTSTPGTASGGRNLEYNQNGNTFVAWNWLASNTTASNTDGSITSTVSANTTSGFSIVSYTGTGANATVGHGLGVAPSMILFKNYSSANNWLVYNKNLGATKFLYLNVTDAEGTDSGHFNDTEPTSTVFSVGTANGTNYSGENLIAYCFAEKQGYSKFGSYTGNGSTDGTFVYTGFKPAFTLIKRTDSATGGSWILFDNKRGTNVINPVDVVLAASNNQTEADWGTTFDCDYLSNGFKWRFDGTAGYNNISGGTYIYMAFAENPFVTSTGVPATAR